MKADASKASIPEKVSGVRILPLPFPGYIPGTSFTLFYDHVPFDSAQGTEQSVIERNRNDRYNTGMKGYMYILECGDGTYYTGSTKNLEKRLLEHGNSMGANYTKKKQPLKLVYFEEYPRIDEAFHREKQVQGWSHAKKKALIESKFKDLPPLSECKNVSHYKNSRIDSTDTSTSLSVRPHSATITRYPS